MEHEPFIRQVIELAITSGKKGNHTFGALLVHEGQVIASAENYDGFAQLLPGPYEDLTIYEIVHRLELPEVEILGPILEDEGMQAFQYWDGEFHPLEELLEETRRIKEARN